MAPGPWLDPRTELLSGLSRAVRLFVKADWAHAITAVQHVRPEFRMRLAGAWQVDKRWQVQEPGQCRAVSSLLMVKGAITLALLWQWPRFAGLLAGMPRLNEIIQLTRRDLIFLSRFLRCVCVLYLYQEP